MPGDHGDPEAGRQRGSANLPVRWCRASVERGPGQYADRRGRRPFRRLRPRLPRPVVATQLARLEARRHRWACPQAMAGPGWALRARVARGGAGSIRRRAAPRLGCTTGLHRHRLLGRRLRVHRRSSMRPMVLRLLPAAWAASVMLSSGRPLIGPFRFQLVRHARTRAWHGRKSPRKNSGAR